MIHIHSCKECKRLVRELGRGDKYVVTRFLPSGDGVDHFVVKEFDGRRLFCTGEAVRKDDEVFFY